MINDKRKEAIALKYDQKTSKAPVILAKGKGKTAETIMEKAMKHDIPVHRDESLAALLGQLDINQTIPEELYGAVAEVFAFIYKVDKDMNR
ncbi:EscU/YscU/HrcU family type III secretion system export apparatus switch protein [Peribacillus frigoritolerans]|uniref:EscU/YscU/HrcU family type III secretion system export apparatus switch protein n=1 Tax=Peribacillus frigoritolerans TaxID=450367 RepID=UPI0024C0421C|nr:EscU/YscU/HrcU family type III secretion system export apparatus switch protein [Peribacillus frigoritolerans]MEB2489648.1 EscU/YscU/HrcU family type III secretion system export apparatus switch protein [Peribacillus frigoritolerans]WHY15623.1 EscU/YscU/HrcU family type III secretion system export apparatus switch protein [Peribacillus frigoritolerans]